MVQDKEILSLEQHHQYQELLPLVVLVEVVLVQLVEVVVLMLVLVLQTLVVEEAVVPVVLLHQTQNL